LLAAVKNLPSLSEFVLKLQVPFVPGLESVQAISYGKFGLSRLDSDRKSWLKASVWLKRREIKNPLFTF